MKYLKVLLLFVLSPFVAAAACDGQIECDICQNDHTTESHVEDEMSRTGGMFEPTSTEDMVDDVLLAFVAKHRGDGFVRVNADPYASAVSESRLNVFVSEFALPEYLETTPELDSSEGMIPRGTFVVREIVDHTGEVTKLTALYRGPEGYNPKSGDFWFAVTDPEGSVLTNASGKRMSGPLESCSSCHAGRASSDYLFGVPAQARPAEFMKPVVEPEPQDTEPQSEPQDPEPQPEPRQPQPQPQAQPSVVDLEGWTIANVQADLTRDQEAALHVEARENSTVVIARRASRAEFEAYWGPLPKETIFVNQNQSGGFEAPIVNGDESWELRDNAGVIIDGPTPAGREGASYRRIDASTDSWTEISQSEASPGVVEAQLPRGIWLTEWSDAEDFRYEFVEIAIR